MWFTEIKIKEEEEKICLKLMNHNYFLEGLFIILLKKTFFYKINKFFKRNYFNDFKNPLTPFDLIAIAIPKGDSSFINKAKSLGFVFIINSEASSQPA